MKGQLRLDEPVHESRPRCLQSRRFDAIGFGQPILTHSSRIGQLRCPTCGRRKLSVPVFGDPAEQTEWSLWHGIYATAPIVQESSHSECPVQNRTYTSSYEVSLSRAIRHLRAVFPIGTNVTRRNGVNALRRLLGGTNMGKNLLPKTPQIPAATQNDWSRTVGSSAQAAAAFPGTAMRLRAASVSARTDIASNTAELKVRQGPAARAENRSDDRSATSRSPEQELSLTKPPVRRDRHRTAKWVGIVAFAVLLIGVMVPIAIKMRPAPTNAAQTVSYVGLYERDMPDSYAGVNAFTAATGVRPDVVMYYSSWLEPFQTKFAITAAEHGAVPLVQINPFQVNLAAITSGTYDGYLTTYAEAVHSYSHQVILSFGHEMNGNWYPWSYTHASPEAFVDAWQHIVTLFRKLGVRNVTWLWTVNVIDTPGNIPSPDKWWPGSSYVTWVGIDGYYSEPSWTFASLFGPTIIAVRTLTRDPILIAETGAAPGTDQSAKVTDLFAGTRLYGLLGFVWFNADTNRDWRLSSPAAIAAFRRGAKTYRRPAS
jgi:mannan endo-1,4-beta-mannosidase